MKKTLFQSTDFKRIIESYENYEIIRDIHHGVNAEICYYKYKESSIGDTMTLNLESDIQISKIFTDKAIGTVVHGIKGETPITIWFPVEPNYYIYDEFGRIRRCDEMKKKFTWNINSQILVSAAEILNEEGEILIPCIKFTDQHSIYFSELSSLSENERKLYRRSEWFFASSIGSIWEYLLHGSLYDPRSNKINGNRFKCQQCAYTWWKYLEKLLSITGKNIYALMRDEVAYSILLDLDDDGGWRHGFWSDDMETHARFHLDGLELFISQYELTLDTLWFEAAQRGMSFIFENLTDHLDEDLLWFLHDTMEDNKHHYFRSTVFGKDSGNSLCINTHTHALRVLYRLHKHSLNDHIYISAYKKGMQALKKVLEYQPASVMYRPIIKWALNGRVMVHKNRMRRKLNSLIKKWALQPLYWKLQEKYPRLVQPNGFIERDLSLTYVSDNYHVTNIKELLKLYELEKSEWLKEYIVNGVRFINHYLSRKGIRNAVRSNPYYIEVIDILVMYSRLIEEIPQTYIETVRNAIYEASGGYSIEGQTTKPETAEVS